LKDTTRSELADRLRDGGAPLGEIFSFISGLYFLDNTNPLPSDRARYIAPARAAGFRVEAYFFEASLRDAIRRNGQRGRREKIPVPGVAATFRKLRAPTQEENIDAVYVVKISHENRFVVTTEFTTLDGVRFAQ
jgi:hypothetical protein